MDMKTFQRLGEHVREQQDALSGDVEPDARLRQRLALRAARRTPARTSGRWLVWSAAVASAVALVAGGLLLDDAEESVTEVSSSPAPALGFDLDGGPLDLGQWIAVPDDAGAALSFSDGSRLELEPGARARVASVSARGAEVVVESGSATVDVVRKPGAAWRVHSGPFVVDVKGTRFSLAWDAPADRFELSLLEGHVVVAGCGVGPQPVAAGQRVVARCSARELSVGPIVGDARGDVYSKQPVAEDADAGTDVVARPEARAPRPAGGVVPPVVVPPSWQRLAEQGRYTESLESVGDDFTRLCDEASAGDLLLLARAARLTGDLRRAERAYRSVHARFAASSAATRAAFGLGLVEASAGRPAAARRWFEQYLQQAPAGPLAEAALGRALESCVAMGDLAAARVHARHYVERYGSGPYARSAKRLLEATRE
jgi:hypothetical protein